MRGQTSALRLGVTTAALVLLLLLNVRLAVERMRRWLRVLEGYRLSTREGGGERHGRRRLWNMGSFSDPATVERRPGGDGLNSSAELFEFENVEDLIQDSSVRAMLQNGHTAATVTFLDETYFEPFTVWLDFYAKLRTGRVLFVFVPNDRTHDKV